MSSREKAVTSVVEAFRAQASEAGFNVYDSIQETLEVAGYLPLLEFILDAAHQAGHIHYAVECLRVEGETCSHGRPDHQELVRQLREAAGLFAGAMPITPKEAFEQALADVRDMRQFLAELADGNGVAPHLTWERILDFMAGPYRRQLLDQHDDKGTE